MCQRYLRSERRDTSCNLRTIWAVFKRNWRRLPADIRFYIVRWPVLASKSYSCVKSQRILGISYLVSTNLIKTLYSVKYKYKVSSCRTS